MINFEKYDKENPGIWKKFVQFSRHVKSKGFKHYSSKGIFELMRYHSKVCGNDKFKINNRYTADYARKMMNSYDEFDGFFRTKELKSERA